MWLWYYQTAPDITGQALRGHFIKQTGADLSGPADGITKILSSYFSYLMGPLRGFT